MGSPFCDTEGCLAPGMVVLLFGDGTSAFICGGCAARAQEELTNAGHFVPIEAIPAPKIQLNRRDRPHRYVKKRPDLLDAPSVYRDNPSNYLLGGA